MVSIVFRILLVGTE